MIDEPIKESNEDKNTEDTEDAGKIKKLGWVIIERDIPTTQVCEIITLKYNLGLS
jgi:hypothetical protein